MNEEKLVNRSPYYLATDVEDVIRLIQKQITDEDNLLALDLISLLRVRIERLENKLLEVE